MNVFDAVKDAVTCRQAAEAYGIRVNRSGMARCPFHKDKDPSLKLDKRFHCFGCGTDGDVINFTAQLFGLNNKEAAEKLADEEDVISAFHQLQKLHQEYREIGPVSKELREEIWQRFRGAMDAFFAKKKEFFSGLKDRQTENLERKTQLCMCAQD